MRNNHRLLCFTGTALLLCSQSALGGSTFDYVLDPDAQTVATNGTASGTLILRETFDGSGSALFDGPGLFSFSVSISQGTSSSGTHATIESLVLDPPFEPLVSSVNFLGPPGAYTGVEAYGAIGLSSLPLTSAAPALTTAGVIELPIATLHFTGSSVLGDTSSFQSSPHPLAAVFPVLDGDGFGIDVEFGELLSVTTVPEPCGPTLLVIAGLATMALRRRRQASNR